MSSVTSVVSSVLILQRRDYEAGRGQTTGPEFQSWGQSAADLSPKSGNSFIGTTLSPHLLFLGESELGAQVCPECRCAARPGRVSLGGPAYKTAGPCFFGGPEES